MTPESPKQSFSLRDSYCHYWLIAAGVFSLTYAIIRYNLFKGVEWEHLPLYVVNKAAALSAVILLASSYLVGKWIHVFEDEPKKRLVLVKFLGLSGFGLAVIHGLMSLAMLSPAYYPKFYGEAKLNLTGELAILCGVLAFLWMSSPAVGSLPYMQESLGMRHWRKAQRTGYLALALAAGHTFFMGFQGWLDPAAWPGSMPPITMLGCAIVILPLVAKTSSGRGPNGGSPGTGP